MEYNKPLKSQRIKALPELLIKCALVSQSTYNLLCGL